jgi:cytochrome b6-f complex iron-sulfur subunit
MDRRDFIQKSILAACGIAAVSATLESCSKNSNPTPAPSGPSANFTIDISTSQYSALQANGGAVYANNLIIARDNTGKFIALYDVCTHAGCTIQFNGTNQFPCPCHGSIFDENGNVVNGPATTPVKKYTTSLAGNILTITG